jgi:hypothetical protein
MNTIIISPVILKTMKWLRVFRKHRVTGPEHAITAEQQGMSQGIILR